jgi:hypothetical protein
MRRNDGSSEESDYESIKTPQPAQQAAQDEDLELERFQRLFERWQSRNKPALQFPRHASAQSASDESASEGEEDSGSGAAFDVRYASKGDAATHGHYQLVGPFQRLMERPGSARALNNDSIKRILRENPEPNGGFCRTPAINDELRHRVSSQAYADDKEIKKLQRSVAQIIRPVLAVAQALNAEDSPLQGQALALVNRHLQDACALYQHSCEQFNTLRRTKIATTSKWGRAATAPLNDAQDVEPDKLFKQTTLEELRQGDQEWANRSAIKKATESYRPQSGRPSRGGSFRGSSFRGSSFRGSSFRESRYQPRHASPLAEPK